MKWSLEISTRWPKFSDEQLELQDGILRLTAGELGALRRGDSGRHCEVRLESHEATPALVDDLVDQGFFETPTSSRMLLDLTPFADLDAYIASLHKRHRQQINHAKARFAALGGRVRSDRLSSLSASEIDHAYDDVYLPAFSARGINPYGQANSRSEFYKLIGGLGSMNGVRTTVLETDERIVGFSIFVVVPVPEQPSDTVTAHWHRDVPPEESMVEFILAHGVPELEESVDLPTLLYLDCIAQGFQEGATMWSPGRERAPFVGNYLGVRAAKRKWGASLRVTVGPHRVFFRLSSKRCLADNLDMELSECDARGLRQVFVMMARSERNQLLVKKAASAARTRLFVLDESDAAYWRDFLDSDREHEVDVRVLSIEA